MVLCFALLCKFIDDIHETRGTYRSYSHDRLACGGHVTTHKATSASLTHAIKSFGNYRAAVDTVIRTREYAECPFPETLDMTRAKEICKPNSPRQVWTTLDCRNLLHMAHPPFCICNRFVRVSVIGGEYEVAAVLFLQARIACIPTFPELLPC